MDGSTWYNWRQSPYVLDSESLFLIYVGIYSKLMDWLDAIGVSHNDGRRCPGAK